MLCQKVRVAAAELILIGSKELHGEGGPILVDESQPGSVVRNDLADAGGDGLATSMLASRAELSCSMTASSDRLRSVNRGGS